LRCIISAIIAIKCEVLLQILSKSLISIFQVPPQKQRISTDTKVAIQDQSVAINKIYFTPRYHKATAG